jgi:hypothetical protein
VTSETVTTQRRVPDQKNEGDAAIVQQALPQGRWAVSRHARLLTREAFEQFIAAARISVSRPCSVVPCNCGDLNCRGWRLVASWQLRRIVAALREEAERS